MSPTKPAQGGNRIALVGLGAMGLPMALNLSGLSGHSLIGVDPSAERRDRAVRSGLIAEETMDCLVDAAFVVVMVATPDQLRAVVDAAPRPSGPQCWILMGTFGPDPVLAAARVLERSGASVLDAPVTGGVRGAESAGLQLFCAADDATFEHALVVLRALGHPHRAGRSPGDGQRLKAVNQLLCTVHLAAAAEALNLAERLGLDTTMVATLLGRGAATSWMFEDRGPNMLAVDEPAVRSSVDVFVKDAEIVRMVAGTVEAPVPVLEAAGRQFGKASAAGLGRRDDSRIFLHYRSMSGESGA